MTATRWTLILVTGLAGVAGLLYATRERAEGPPVRVSNPAVAALPLSLPAPAVEASASTAPQAAASVRTATPAASAPRIGSEGYGPHIDSAQADNDAQAAWEAVQWLRNCTSNEARRNSFEHVRAQGVVPDLMTQLMVEADAEARRCQTVTAQHRAMLPELAARAMRAGVPEAASAYANAVFPGDLTPTQRQEVTDAMRRDAQAGHVQSLLGALVSNEAWGLSEVEKLGYMLAYGNLPDHPETQAIAKTLMEQGAIHIKGPPTPEQLAAAKLAAQQIVERVRAGKPP